MQKSFLITFIGSVLVILFLCETCYSQTADKLGDDPVDLILENAESVYKADDRLINGTYYTPKYPLAIGHPYFETDQWIKATLYIKSLTYPDVFVKLNIEDDLIIYKRQHRLGLVEEILLNNFLVDSLRIDEHLFINTSSIDIHGTPGILEFLCKGKYDGYMKYLKYHKDELTHQVRYGRYMDVKRELYLFDGEKFIRVNDKHKLLELFPAHEKAIVKFMRRNKIKFKHADKVQFVTLLRYCDEF